MPGIDALERFVGNLEREVRLAVNDTLHEGFALATQYSSGTLTEADLIAQDHPYALRHGSPQQDPTIINVRTGDFRRGWRAEGPQSGGGAISGRIYNVDPKAAELKAGLVNGRRLMFTRDVDDRVAAELWPRFQARLALAIVRAAR